MPKIRVKIIGNYRTHVWIRQFPAAKPCWGDCEFLFDLQAKAYDWLVVYNDFPGDYQEELLPREDVPSILVTTEPATIKSYGHAYTGQFRYVLTSQDPRSLPHPGRIFSQPALQWFYGLGEKGYRGYDEMATEPWMKSKNLSTVCSTKRQKHTLHNQRYLFTQALKAKIPQMDIYGHGVIEMDDKAEALDDYRYHLAIENFIGEHHWTEKLSDVFLGCALPFYCGCPNAADYFPAESFIPLDINDVESAAETILKAMRDQEYELRLPAILEARRLVMEKYNIFAVLADIIADNDHRPANRQRGARVMSRRLLRKKRPLVALADCCEKARQRIRWAR